MFKLSLPSLPATLAALTLGATLAFGNTAAAQQMVSIAKSEANMRSGPGTRHAVQWALSKGYPLKVVARQGNWLKVQDFEKDGGWVARSMTGRTPHHIVTAKVANLRSTASQRGRLQGKLVYGEVVKTLKKQSGWVQVQREDGTRGWVAQRLVWGW